MPKQKWLREFSLGMAKDRNVQAGYRESPTLLKPTARRVTEFKRGIPTFSSTIDTIQNVVTGNRQYRSGEASTSVDTNYTADSYHEMKAKFRFHLTGIFPNSGSAFESELHKQATTLHLLGFIKARSQYAMGNLQGDAFALSYMRKWLEDKCNKSGTVKTVHVYDESFGIPEIKYSKLECIKDWRSPLRRMQHMAAIHEQTKLDRLRQDTRQKERDLEDRTSRVRNS